MSRKRPEFAEDVYGGNVRSDGPPAGGRSTVTVSGGRYGNPSSWAFNSSTISSSSSSMSGLLSSVSDGGTKINSLSWHDSSKSDQNGESSTKNESDSNPLVGDLDFQYTDSDRYEVELAELYTYSEMEDFLQNFEEFCMYLLRTKHEKTERWVDWSAASKSRLMQDVLQGLDSADSNVRLDAARLLLYILQGTYGDYTESDDEEDEDDGKSSKNKNADYYKDDAENGDELLEGFFHRISQRLKKADGSRTDLFTPPDVDGVVGKDRGTGGHDQHCLLNAATNAYFAYESGLFQALCSMLACERETTSRRNLAKQHSLSSLNSSVGGGSLASGQSSAGHRRSATLADNESLRVVINCLYHMVESIRRPELVAQVADFCRTLADRRPHAFAPYRDYTVERLTKLRDSFLAEIDEPLDMPKMPLVICLFDMMTEFVRGRSRHFPIKKLLLLTWKILLATLGGIDVLREGKMWKRRALGLSPIEDTLEVAMRMKPVPYVGDNNNEGTDNVFISRLSRIGLRNSKVVSMECGGKMRFLNRQTACASGGEGQKSQDDDEETTAGSEANGEMPQSGAESTTIADEDVDDAFRNDNEEPKRKFSDVDAPVTPKADADGFSYELTKKPADGSSPTLVDDNNESRQARCEHEFDLKIQKMLDRPPKSTAFSRRSSRSSARSSTAGDQTPRASSPELEGVVIDAAPSLPWRTKAREKDIEAFLQKAREKYFGYTLPGDSTTTFGLPAPVVHSVNVFRRNVYVSPSDLEVAAAERFNRYRFSQTEVIKETKVERLYQRMLPNMSEYAIVLLKVILASLPASKMKNDAVVILSDVLTPETDTNDMLSSSMSFELSGKNVLEEAVRFAIDVNRHKELIVKASTAIIILLLKFFKLSHIHQFDTFSQHMILANGLPLILKFIDQNMLRYIKSKHELTPFNYPQCALHYVRNDGEWPVLNADNVFVGEQDERSYYLWRNVFASVNVLRILNKLIKWRKARTGMMIVFKTSAVFKRCMTIRVGILQLYALKVLKMMARFLGRPFRKSHMHIVSAIYTRVRHRFNDDWAFANETRRTWEFHAEECAMAVILTRFNNRRYAHLFGEEGYVSPAFSTPASNLAGSVGSSISGFSSLGHVVKVPLPAMKKSNVGARLPGGPLTILDGDNDFEVRDEEAEADYPLDDGSLQMDGIDSSEFESYDNDLQSVLSCQPQFSERFRRNWRKWLQDEVLDHSVDWDFLLESTGTIAFEDKFFPPVAESLPTRKATQTAQ